MPDTKFTKQQVCDAMRVASKKMHDNPDSIIWGVLARNDKGVKVSTLDPSATCFCALGRLAAELGIDTWNTANLVAKLPDVPRLSHIWIDNDDGYVLGDKLRGANTMLAVANEECPTDV